MKVSPALIYTLIVSLGGFIFGFDASVISGTVGFVTTEFGLNAWQQGLVVSSPTLGGILATLTAGSFADRLGRKKVLISIALLYLVSAFLSAFAPTFELLIAARFVGGLAFCSLIIAPLYIAEISQASIRGKMVSVNQLNIVLGFSAAYFANYYFLQLSHSDFGLVKTLAIDTQTWRWMLGIETIPAALFFLMLLIVPETPRWLLSNNRTQEANTVLRKLMPEHEVKEYLNSAGKAPASSKLTIKQGLGIMFSPVMKLTLLIGLVVGITQQITGVNAIYFYAPTIFEQSGIGTDAAFMQAIWVGIINIIFTIVAMMFIDKWGRKPLLLIGLTGIFISMSICAAGFHDARYQLNADKVANLPAQVDRQSIEPLIGKPFDNDIDYKNALQNALGEQQYTQHQSSLIQAGIKMNANLILIGILTFVASFAVSLGPVMWVLFSEIFPTHIRGMAISFVGIINSIVSFIVQLLFPLELASLGNALTFFIYGIFALLGLILVYRILPETKGKSLEQLEAELISPTSQPTAETVVKKRILL